MSKYDINEPLNVWEDGLNNSRKRKQEWIDSLIEKYGFPVREENLLKEDFALHNMVKDDLEKMEKDYYAYQSQPRGSSLDDEDMERNAEIVKVRKDTEKSNYKLSLNDLASIALDTLKYTPEALGEMLADGIIAKEHLQAMKKTNKKLVDKYGKNTGAADGTDNYYHALLQCQLAKISPESQDYGLRAGYLKEIYDYHKKKGNMPYDILIEDMRKDLKNNRHGSNLGARNRKSNKSCSELLANYRTRNMKNENIK